MSAYVYMLECSDKSFYVGSARDSLERRVAEHNAGHYGGWTASRRPVRLVFHREFAQITDAIAAERQLKGWSRAKKQALIAGDWKLVSQLARRSARDASPFETRPSAAPQDEANESKD